MKRHKNHNGSHYNGKKSSHCQEKAQRKKKKKQEWFANIERHRSDGLKPGHSSLRRKMSFL